MEYNYREALINDIKEYIKDNDYDIVNYNDQEEMIDEIYYDLWDEDSITGNGGDWYDTEEKCQEYVSKNLILAFEACEDFCVDMKTLIDAAKKGNIARYLDCIVRCYLLHECLYEVCKEN